MGKSLGFSHDIIPYGGFRGLDFVSNHILIMARRGGCGSQVSSSRISKWRKGAMGSSNFRNTVGQDSSFGYFRHVILGYLKNIIQEYRRTKQFIACRVLPVRKEANDQITWPKQHKHTHIWSIHVVWYIWMWFGILDVFN